jgi:hypothetical protein
MHSESKFVFSKREVIELVKAAVEDTVGDRLCEVIFNEDDIVFDGDFESVSIKMTTDDSKYHDEDEEDEDEEDEEDDFEEDEEDEAPDADVPKCFGVYERKDACHTCGVRTQCINTTDDDEDDDEDEVKVERKPIHLAVIVDNTGQYIYATCDDGSLWLLMPVGDWNRLPSIPQHDVQQGDTTPRAKVPKARR